MRRSLGLLVAAAAISAMTITGSAQAQSSAPYVGKWSTKLTACAESESSFVVEAAAIILPTLSCDKVTFTRDGTAWRGQASNCAGEEGDIGAMSFRLIVDGGTLQFDWLNGTKSGKLVRCPK